MSSALTAPAATIVDNKTGNATSIDLRAYRALKVFLRAIGAAYNDDSADDVRLTTGQAAEVVGSSSRTIARLIDSGKLKGTRVGNGRRYVMLSDLLAFDQEAKKDRGIHLDAMHRIASAESFYSHNDAMSEYLKGFE